MRRTLLSVLALSVLVGGPLMQLAYAAPPVAAASDKLPTASELLAAMDANMKFDTRAAKSIMRVVDARSTREYTMQTYARGENEAAIDYIAPERDKGTRMLKKGDQFWMYLPRAERVQQISGHMLQQGMMGSDVSYEDMVAAADFEKQYAATVLGVETLDGHEVYKLEAIARDNTVSYPRRVMWIDKATMMPMKQEMYALSGMKLKTWTMSDFQKIGERWTANRTVINDELKQGSYTELITSEVKYGVAVDDDVFSIRWLDRK